MINKEIHAFIIDNYRGRLTSELTAMINKKFGTSFKDSKIRNYKHNKGLASGVNTQWGHGQVNRGSFKKGESHPASIPTQFKKGQKPKNTVAIGAEVLRADGLIWVKIHDRPGPHNIAGRWKQRARIIYEQHHGPLTAEDIVLHLDGNSQNDDIKNLVAVTRKKMAYINRNDLIYNDPELTKLGLTIAEISQLSSQIQKGRK